MSDELESPDSAAGSVGSGRQEPPCPAPSAAELRLTLALDGFDVRAVDFLRWLVASGRDPEFEGV